jgi:two-component system, OmpR family, phosphate regulon sensor histidine kinase PhoR
MAWFPWTRRATPALPPSTSQSIDHAQAGERQNMARWQALLEATDDAILLADAQGHLLLSNAVADHLFALPPHPQRADVTGGAGNKLLAQTLSSELDEIYREAVRVHSLVEAEVTLTHPLPRTLYARVMPVSQSEYLLVLHDLTELRRLERIRRDFVANVSHELRTPLTSIKAMAETLADGARTDEAVATRFLQTIIHESDRLVRLSSDLLDLSRVEARGVEKRPVELAALVNEVAARLTSQAQQAAVQFANTVRAPLIVPVDRDEMAQVLVNLLDNAITYTPGGGSVKISALETATDVSILVSDTGIGILSHDIPRLFERFYRADKARSRASGGTGLGLSIVKHIVESHGGSVRVESEFNKGSTFTITLPK